jgi:hypothetical protein
MVDAADAVLLIPSPEEVSASVGASGAYDSSFSTRVPEGDQLLTKQFDGYRRAIWFR